MATFTPRLTAPAANNKSYIHYNKGGYSICKIIDEKTGRTLPNCVGLAYGRQLECQGIKKADWKIPACNAEDWVITAQKNGLKTGTTPKLGAAICWSSGQKQNSSDGCGHVAVVEKIAADGTITISESAYKGYEFKTEEVKPPYARNGMKFEGFVYTYTDFGTGDLGKTEPQKPASKTVSTGQQIKLNNTPVYIDEYGTKAGKRTGTYYVWDGTPTRGYVKMTNNKAYCGVKGKVSFWCKVSEIV